MASSGLVDPTKPAKYPVILSDALLGRPSTELYTGLRYNHKPSLTSALAPNSAKLKPSTNGSYDLSFTDDGGKYAYNGTRSKDETRCILVFDPSRKAFVLHRLDSTFDMNLTRTPTNHDRQDLKQQYPHLEPRRQAKATAARKSKPISGKAAEVKQTSKKSEATPTPKAETPQRRPKSPSEAEAEDEEDDGGGSLLVEYPEGDLSRTSSARQQLNRNKDFSPAFAPRRFSEYVNNQNSESDADADAEYDEDEEGEEEEEEEGEGEDREMTGFKLPSPLNRHGGHDDDGGGGGGGEMDMGFNDADLVGDLEAELEKELSKEANAGRGSESEVSEED